MNASNIASLLCQPIDSPALHSFISSIGPAESKREKVYPDLTYHTYPGLKLELSFVPSGNARVLDRVDVDTGAKTLPIVFDFLTDSIVDPPQRAGEPSVSRSRAKRFEVGEKHNR